MDKAGGVHLLVKKLLIDQAVEDGAAVIVGELCEGAIAEKSLVTEGLIPIGLQNHVAVDRGDDAIEYLGGGASGNYERRRAQQGECSEGKADARLEIDSQNG
jgi:hypothetical protein